ncbi:MAG: hypothetical protein Q4F67_13060, partial [Propionibacteriaceae bacterium]|nr:hypothetical protein [Propionibacteriaceae bacterium]
SLLGPFDIANATLLLDRRHYVGRFVHKRDGETVLLAFLHDGDDGQFVGGISDPMRIEWRDGAVRLA